MSCPGTCCESITLSVPLERILEAATALFGYRSTWTVSVQDDERIIDLLEIDPERPGHYTCTAFDAQRGLCTAYDQRPDLCRRYPYGLPCEHCTYDDRQPDQPGLPYRPVQETGFFTPWEDQ